MAKFVQESGLMADFGKDSRLKAQFGKENGLVTVLREMSGFRSRLYDELWNGLSDELCR